MLGFTLLFVVTGLLLVALAIPLIRRRVRPNFWYGVRTAATLADERVWYEANAASGRDLLALGVAEIVLALVLPWTGLSPTAYAGTVTVVLGAGALLLAAVGIARARRLLRDRAPAPAGDTTTVP